MSLPTENTSTLLKEPYYLAVSAVNDNEGPVLDGNNKKLAEIKHGVMKIDAGVILEYLQGTNFLFASIDGTYREERNLGTKDKTLFDGRTAEGQPITQEQLQQQFETGKL